jgi:nicotinamide phosphoribosyltransferase
MKMNSLFLTDGYKTGHHQQYPKGTNRVYSNWTPRGNKYAPRGCDKVVSFGQQMVLRWLVDEFETNFFSKPKDLVCQEMKRELSMYLNSEYDVTHFEELHDLGYLPIEVKSLPEGVEVPLRIPILTVQNTGNFGWVTNFLETVLSNMLWQPMTSATIALLYKRILTEGATETDKDNIPFVDFQGHDFSMRGMGGFMSTILSGLGHATSFSGSDSLPVIAASRGYYDETGFVVGSVNATEHSVMCAGTKGDEIGTFRRLMETYPTGILSIVSDTWDLWTVVTDYLPTLKDEIMERDGKIVIRPDSGDPVDILCGYNTITQYEMDEKRIAVDVDHPSNKGLIELLWDTFGGTVNSQGYKVLDPHIGAIYGDSITPARAKQIITRLKAKGFASTNIVLGIGSYTYQFNTRDTFGFAMKATYVEVNGEGREIFKDPITDDGLKKSARGLLLVQQNEINGDYELYDMVSSKTEKTGELKTIFKDGKFYNETTLSEVRSRLNDLLLTKKIDLELV